MCLWVLDQIEYILSIYLSTNTGTSCNTLPQSDNITIYRPTVGSDLGAIAAKVNDSTITIPYDCVDGYLHDPSMQAHGYVTCQEDGTFTSSMCKSFFHSLITIIFSFMCSLSP